MGGVEIVETLGSQQREGEWAGKTERYKGCHPAGEVLLQFAPEIRLQFRHDAQGIVTSYMAYLNWFSSLPLLFSMSLELPAASSEMAF